jgi:AcrR family transcriptional regulator
MGPGGAAGALRRDLKQHSPRTADARERLVAAASDVLREYGYRAAPLEAILSRSRVARSNLYYHFAGKLELACAAVDSWERAPGARPSLQALEDESLGGLERVRRYVEAVVRFSRSGPCGCPYGRLAAEADLPEPLRMRVERALGELQQGIEAALRAGVRDGSVRAVVDPVALASTVMAAVEGAGLLARAARNAGRIPACFEGLLDLLGSVSVAERDWPTL